MLESRDLSTYLIKSTYRYILFLLSSVPFYKIMVPTVDTVRYDFLVYNLIQAKQPVLLVGPVGTGKTSVVQKVLQRLDPKIYSLLVINMSAQTTSNNVQDIIENKVEKRTKGELNKDSVITHLDPRVARGFLGLRYVAMGVAVNNILYCIFRHLCTDRWQTNDHLYGRLQYAC